MVLRHLFLLLGSLQGPPIGATGGVVGVTTTVTLGRPALRAGSLGSAWAGFGLAWLASVWLAFSLAFGLISAWISLGFRLDFGWLSFTWISA